MASDFSPKRPTIVLKVGMLGDSHVGKTTLMVKYVEEKYDQDYIPTLGVNCLDRKVSFKNTDVIISIWDLGGEKELSTMMPLVCLDAKAILFMFDLTSMQSLHNIKNWYKECNKETRDYIPFLIGTKYDLFETMDDKYKQEINKLSKQYSEKKMKYAPRIYCSSVNGTNINEIFKVIVGVVFDINSNIKEIKKGPILRYKIKSKKKKHKKDENNENDANGNLESKEDDGDESNDEQEQVDDIENNVDDIDQKEE